MFVAGGAYDRVISEQLNRFTATRYGGEVVMYPELAHWLLEEPGSERVADDVEGWSTACCDRCGRQRGHNAEPAAAARRAVQ